jgi:mRNA-degrading endonuclease RelE of RelBE toxin-antitoxin system
VNRVLFSKEAVRSFRQASAASRRLLKEGIQKHLAEGDPLETTRNKFRLRRPSQHAEFELRLQDWRVFYRVRDGIVEIVLLGEKRGNVLLIGGEEFEL